MNQNYEYVTRREVRPYREELEKIIHNLQKLCRQEEKDLTFQYHLIGSQGRHLVTRIKNGNGGFDFDYNLVLNCEEGYSWKPEYARPKIFKCLKEAIKGTHFNKIENSTSVITIKYVSKNKVIVGCDFSVVYYPDDEDYSYYKYVRFNKAQNKFTWEERTLSRNVQEKLDWLSENVEDYWNEIKEEYLILKNNNSDPNKHSFILYYEAINNVYNYFKQRSRSYYLY